MSGPSAIDRSIQSAPLLADCVYCMPTASRVCLRRMHYIPSAQAQARVYRSCPRVASKRTLTDGVLGYHSGLRAQGMGKMLLKNRKRGQAPTLRNAVASHCLRGPAARCLPMSGPSAIDPSPRHCLPIACIACRPRAESVCEGCTTFHPPKLKHESTALVPESPRRER